MWGQASAVGGARPACGAAGEEQRAAAAPVDQSGQQPGAAGLEVQHLHRAALADDAGPFVGQVEVVDVEPEQLLGPPGGLGKPYVDPCVNLSDATEALDVPIDP